MYKFSIAPSDFLAPGFEQKLALCDRTGCAYVELSDILEGTFLGDMDGNTIETMRNLLIDYGKTISLITYTGNIADRERFCALLRNAHFLGAKAIKVCCEGYDSVEAAATDVTECAQDAKCYGIRLCVENRHDSLLSCNKDMELLVKTAGDNVYTIFNPVCYAYMRAHPFFHEFYGSKLKNNIAFLRVNDGLFCERRPALPGQGNAEIKELASILLSRSFDGYFSFTDYFGQMSWEDLQTYIAAFKMLLKQM